MGVEEVNEVEEEVVLEPEAGASPLPPVPEEFLSCKCFSRLAICPSFVV